MWLLDTETLRLYRDKDEHDYAILSHRWTEHEISFKHMSDAFRVGDAATDPEDNEIISEIRSYYQNKLEKLDGWLKIINFCKKARSIGLEYAWIDTCCIDQSSSAELQESINSMYSWYSLAKICFVYMNDVQMQDDGVPTQQFKQSEWFKRGWTLQELLAPKSVVFVDKIWRELGTKVDLADSICGATQISRDAVVGPFEDLYIRGATVSEKMFWTSRRNTTRDEDMAYCLLGLFNVNMPLLYGEGLKRAFLRLQTEIMRMTNDETIFVWNAKQPPERVHQTISPDLGLLAASPHFFRDIKGSQTIPSSWNPRPPYEMTNYGLRIELQLFSYKESRLKFPFGRISEDIFIGGPSHDKFANLFISPLGCSIQKTIIFICLIRVSGANNWYRRIGDWIEAPAHYLESKKLQSRPSTQIIIVRDDLRYSSAHTQRQRLIKKETGQLEDEKPSGSN